MSRALTIALVLGGIVLFFTLAIRHASRKERRAVEAAKRLLPGYKLEGLSHRFTGEVRGVEVTMRLFQKAGRNRGGPWTEVLVPLPLGISLELRPQDPVEAHLAASGLARDVILGDPAFDRAFIVEMAPASLSASIFDVTLRRLLIELAPVEMNPREGGGLSLAKEDWDDERFPALIEAGALLAERLRQAGGAETERAEAGGSSHATKRIAEQAELDRIRGARSSYRIRGIVIVVVGLLAIMVLRSLLS